MSNGAIKRYGILVAILLAVANIIVFGVQEGEVSNRKSSQANKYTGGLTKIPLWIQQESSADSNVDLFSGADGNNTAQSSNVEKNTIQGTDILNVPELEEMPGEVGLDSSTDKTIRVLAISRNGSGVSGMVEVDGRVYVVSPGDVIENRYLVRRIDEHKIWFDLQ